MTSRFCNWKPQEDNRLLFFVGVEPPSVIAHRLGKTERAVIDRYKDRHGGSFLRATAKAGGMSVLECAQALGVKHARVRAWIRHKWLRARRRIVIRNYLYTVEECDLEAFLRERGGLLEGLCPADPYWVAVIQDARAALLTRYIEGGELSAVFCRDRRQFGTALITRAGFPRPSLALQGREQWYERTAVRDWLRTAPARYRTPRALRAFGLEDS